MSSFGHDATRSSNSLTVLLIRKVYHTSLWPRLTRLIDKRPFYGLAWVPGVARALLQTNSSPACLSPAQGNSSMCSRSMLRSIRTKASVRTCE
jgi:hypothetical protein